MEVFRRRVNTAIYYLCGETDFFCCGVFLRSWCLMLVCAALASWWRVARKLFTLAAGTSPAHATRSQLASGAPVHHRGCIDRAHPRRLPWRAGLNGKEHCFRQCRDCASRAKHHKRIFTVHVSHVHAHSSSVIL